MSSLHRCVWWSAKSAKRNESIYGGTACEQPSLISQLDLPHRDDVLRRPTGHVQHAVVRAHRRVDVDPVALGLQQGVALAPRPVRRVAEVEIRRPAEHAREQHVLLQVLVEHDAALAIAVDVAELPADGLDAVADVVVFRDASDPVSLAAQELVCGGIECLGDFGAPNHDARHAPVRVGVYVAVRFGDGHQANLQLVGPRGERTESLGDRRVRPQPDFEDGQASVDLLARRVPPYLPREPDPEPGFHLGHVRRVHAPVFRVAARLRVALVRLGKVPADDILAVSRVDLEDVVGAGVESGAHAEAVFQAVNREDVAEVPERGAGEGGCAALVPAQPRDGTRVDGTELRGFPFLALVGCERLGVGERDGAFLRCGD